MKATLFMAQNTNNDHLVRAACLNRKKDPASERDSDRPVDQRKNDGVDHASLHCFLRTRRITLPVQAFRFHRGRLDRRHAQSSRSPGRRRRPGRRRQKGRGQQRRLNPSLGTLCRRAVARGRRGSCHPERAHELKLLGCELSCHPDSAHSIDRDARALGERFK